ncbi:ACP phosphodiesterase [Pontibacter sp. SGAir0037]|uniref:acyl carrier protein phosphodiesterase n=1 Tax=Pontibacter sp. SGAir0037 TaxID=2571030 RepID=UPI0010CD0FCD|nr:ACP phosphodiesterase [Pontibacter sp. SGAir0037]QCR22015.1 DUF479 domain-containing protein [Pontibacter sp. SGAir0037]
MNFLAHIFLSGDDEELLLGNFIADSVKGKQMHLYQPGIAKGIRLHRLIDTYTDMHPVVMQTKRRLRPHYGKFSPVIADIFYDHFLAKQFGKFSAEPLSAYAARIYSLIQQHHHILPARVQYMLPYMVEQNWLLSYAALPGIKQVLTGMSRRTTFYSGMETASEELEKQYSAYQADFEAFFPDLQAYVQVVKKDLE